MRYPNAPRPCLISCLCSLVLIVLVQASAIAQDSVRVAYIDPLSGGGASIGEVGVKTFQFMADEINAKGGVLGKKLEIVPYDNKLNPQESLVQVQKAIDTGIRIVTQGNGSSVAAAISDFAAKFNERNPGREFLFLNYAAVDPVLTNDKCNYWHFRWDANSDIKMEALTNYMKTRPSIKKLYLINQDYSFGQAVRAAAKTMLLAKRPDIQVVGDEMHPLLKITDFAPYVAKIKASGADSVVTGNWGQDFALLLKAAADAGLQVDWYTITPVAPEGLLPSSRVASTTASSTSPRGTPISRIRHRRILRGCSAPSMRSV
jgi:branched-chain amino acid transport system substrate-binding protein